MYGSFILWISEYTDIEILIFKYSPVHFVTHSNIFLNLNIHLFNIFKKSNIQKLS